jgi:hypothetical protein
VNVGLVMDTSALLVHLRLERVSVGELIGEVNEGGDLVGVPALAVFDALLTPLADDELSRLHRMIEWDDNGIVILPLSDHDPLYVYQALKAVNGGQGVAHAVIEAAKHGCLLATDRPHDLGRAIDLDDVVVLS